MRGKPPNAELLREESAIRKEKPLGEANAGLLCEEMPEKITLDGYEAVNQPKNKFTPFFALP